MQKKPDDDLFKDSVMTFGEHLNELRGCLWRALWGILIGFAVGLFFADYVVLLIQAPLKAALEKYYLDSAEARLVDLQKTDPSIGPSDAKAIVDQGLVFEKVFVYPQQLADALRRADPDQATEVPIPTTSDLQPLLIFRTIDDDPRTHAKSFAGQEPFMIWLKAALITGLVLAAPWVFYQVWQFVAAGLYPQEKKYVHVYLPFSIGLFVFGAVVSLFVFEPILKFFLSFNRSLNIEPEPRISEWLSFVMMLPLGFGIAFQLPLVMLFLERIGVFTVATYLSNWRVAVLVIWVIAAIVTPADPYSIFFLAVPLMLLFFGGILLCKWWPKHPAGERRLSKSE